MLSSTSFCRLAAHQKQNLKHSNPSTAAIGVSPSIPSMNNLLMPTPGLLSLDPRPRTSFPANGFSKSNSKRTEPLIATRQDGSLADSPKNSISTTQKFSPRLSGILLSVFYFHSPTLMISTFTASTFPTPLPAPTLTKICLSKCPTGTNNSIKTVNLSSANSPKAFTALSKQLAYGTKNSAVCCFPPDGANMSPTLAFILGLLPNPATKLLVYMSTT